MSQERRIVPRPLRPRRPGSGSGPMARPRAIHASEPVPGDFDPVDHNTRVLLADVANLDNPLHVEWAISRFLPCWGDEPDGFDMEYIESTTHLIIDELLMTDNDRALLALRGLQAVAGGRIAKQAREAAAVMAAGGITLLPWTQHIGQAQAVDARVMRNDEDDSCGVMIEYAYPDGDRHTLAAFIADELNGAVKFMGLTKSLDEAIPQNDPLPLRPIDPAEAQRLIRDALEATDQVHARFEGDPSMREFGALAWSRVRG
jgi:hypothetical protein